MVASYFEPIPEISKQFLGDFFGRVRPMARFIGGGGGEWRLHPRGRLYYIRLSNEHARELSFLNAPLPEKPASVVKFTQIHTRHQRGKIFSPTIAEVAVQIPSDLISRICAFETVQYSSSGEYDLAITALYRQSED